jgi:DNA-binding CsgD family transcriptional regulator
MTRYWTPRSIRGTSKPSKLFLAASAADGKFASQLSGDLGRVGIEIVSPYMELTPREREVLTWVAEGKTAPETATLLGISERAVRLYRENAMAKLGAHTNSKLRKGITSCDAVLFVVPGDETAGQWAVVEAGAARALKKPILAVVTERSRKSTAKLAESIAGSTPINAAALKMEAVIGQIVSRLPGLSGYPR